MSRIILTFTKRLFIIVFFYAFLSLNANAQGASFTFQGKLNDNNVPASGTYEMQFKLLDNVGTQISVTNTINNVTVINGIFTVRLLFGFDAFNGEPRFLEIAVRPAGSANPFTILNPPQSFLSAPYAIRSKTSETADLATNATIAVNSTQLGGINADQYVLTGDVRLTDDRNPTAGSGNYIQNTTSPQTTSNFNISGTGRAAIFNATTNFSINGNRVLSSPVTSNIFAGVNSGNNTTGTGNAFFGGLSGTVNTTGVNNAFFGFNAGSANVGGGANTFIGVNAGIANVGSSNNTFIGANAGNTNLTSNGNTYLGANSDGGFLVTNSVAIGQKAFVGQSNSLILGSINGVNTATADTLVGIGTSTPTSRLHLVNNNDFSFLVESNAPLGAGIELKSNRSQAHNWLIYTGDNQNFGYDLFFLNKVSNTVVMSLRGDPSGGGAASFDTLVAETIFMDTPPADGDAPLCFNSFNLRIALCSNNLAIADKKESLKDIKPFSNGISIINKINPVTFRLKSNGRSALGFFAEDVAKIDPLLVNYNAQGEVEEVKYESITTVLVNAFKEQQVQISAQQKQIDELKQIVCLLKSDAAVCREK